MRSSFGRWCCPVRSAVGPTNFSKNPTGAHSGCCTYDAIYSTRTLGTRTRMDGTDGWTDWHGWGALYPRIQTHRHTQTLAPSCNVPIRHITKCQRTHARIRALLCRRSAYTQTHTYIYARFLGNALFRTRTHAERSDVAENLNRTVRAQRTTPVADEDGGMGCDSV